MKTKSFFKAAAVALTIATISGIPASPLTSNASAAVVLDSKDQDAKAVKIIERFIEELGGREKLEGIKSVNQTGAISIAAAGITGTIDLSITSPGKLRLVVDMPMVGKNVQGVNDGIVWSTDAMNGPRILPDEEAKSVLNQTNLQLVLGFLERYPTIEYLEEIEFDGQSAHKIHLVDTDGDESTEFYSVESGLHIGLEQETDTPMGKINIITTIRDYKELGGYLQPTTTVQKLGATEILFTIENAVYNKVDDSVYELPEAVKGLIKATEAKEKAAP